jgi:transcriptional regulator with XRE-family HTH domain
MVLRYKEQLGAAMRARRDELGMTQKQVASAAHVEDAQTVSRWERGQNLPSDLEAVAGALKWTVAELMAGIQAPPRVARKLDITPADDQSALAERLARMEARLEEIYALLSTGETSGLPAVGRAGSRLLEAAESHSPPAPGRSGKPRAARRPRSA